MMFMDFPFRDPGTLVLLNEIIELKSKMISLGCHIQYIIYCICLCSYMESGINLEGNWD